jgi:hypothetical protein
MTTERLHSETARANAAERQIADVMSLFKDVHDQKVKLERELMRVREELGLYKVQLDVAQKGRNFFFYNVNSSASAQTMSQRFFVHKRS